jgi:hypothetical protein
MAAHGLSTPARRLEADKPPCGWRFVPCSLVAPPRTPIRNEEILHAAFDA